jgi:two-component system response regulator LytT
MKIAIIEDEELTARDLAETIARVAPQAEIAAILGSVKDSVSYFQNNEKPDLIFCDIQLGDGLSFEIFKRVPLHVPIIFCTAYDEYALKAFKANGIDYILKPFTQKTITDALTRYDRLRSALLKSAETLKQIAGVIETSMRLSSASILVYVRDRIIPIKVNDIALFYIQNEITHIVTFGQKIYSVDKSINDLESIVGNDFYRANRKFLVSRKTIKDVAQHFHRKLSLHLNISIDLPGPITVSKVKTANFLRWLSGT